MKNLAPQAPETNASPENAMALIFSGSIKKRLKPSSGAEKASHLNNVGYGRLKVGDAKYLVRTNFAGLALINISRPYGEAR